LGGLIVSSKGGLLANKHVEKRGGGVKSDCLNLKGEEAKKAVVLFEVIGRIGEQSRWTWGGYSLYRIKKDYVTIYPYT